LSELLHENETKAIVVTPSNNAAGGAARGLANLFSNIPSLKEKVIGREKIERLLKEIGSDTGAVYRVENYRLSEAEQDEILAQVLEESLLEEPTEFMQLNIKLGYLCCDTQIGLLFTLIR
jgi:hypothetical protein